jgi:hypothetical protein
MDQAIATLIAVLIGGSITFATNYLVERQKSKNEEKERRKEEAAKKLSLRYQAYIQFLGVKHEDVRPKIYNPANPEWIDTDGINKTSASVMAYGSPKVSSLLARSFPLRTWESIEKTKRMIISELVEEKGGKLSISASIEATELDAYMGIGDGLSEKGQG